MPPLVHNHLPTRAIHLDCAYCRIHGNIFTIAPRRPNVSSKD
jgi:hypothetical protein